MKFILSTVLLVSAVKALPFQQRQAQVDPSLVPDFGVTPGVKDPAGSASCVGINDKLIPCTCPPSRDAFIASVSANVANGHDVNNPAVAAPFPTDNSIASQITRMQTLLSSLQNLNGPGVGCPAVSTTFSAQLSALQAQQSGAAAPAAASPAAAAPASNLVDASLIPDFGVTAGVKDPAGSASCVGINGKLIPCTCPPSRDDFIASVSANVANGHDVNNPAVAAPFPTDDSIASQITRMQTLLSSLQNLNGAGVGCPAVSTTFSAQLASLQAQQSGAAAPAAATPATTAPAAAAPATALVDASLIPDFGVTPGVKDPAGSASCVGINGKLIPCTCPPSRDAFIASVSANVANGHDVNNPAVAAPFPTDDSIASQITRMQTLLSSLQNLNGAGVGCPAVSTTFSAQLAALQAQQ